MRTSRVGDQLIKRYPDFDVRNFGSKSLNKFLASLPELEVEERILANGNPIQFVRVKPVPKPVKKPAPRRTAKRTTRKRSKGEIRLSRQTVEKVRSPWPLCEGLRPQAVGERTVRLPDANRLPQSNSPGHIACPGRFHFNVPKPENPD